MATKTSYYDREMTDSYNAVIRTCTVRDGKVIDELVWQKNGNARGFDQQMYIGQTVDEIKASGFKLRR